MRWNECVNCGNLFIHPNDDEQQALCPECCERATEIGHRIGEIIKMIGADDEAT